MKRSSRYSRWSAKEKRQRRRERLARVAVRREERHQRAWEGFTELLGVEASWRPADPRGRLFRLSALH